METKHTPGPWKAVRNSSFWEIEPANAGQDGVPFNIGDVCASEPGFPDAGLQEANARLIAAAPELLEALQLFTEFRAALGKTGAKVSIADVEKATRAAIAKATGQ